MNSHTQCQRLNTLIQLGGIKSSSEQDSGLLAHPSLPVPSSYNAQLVPEKQKPFPIFLL